MNKGYKKITTYTFEAGGKTWEITGWDATLIEISETTKNGQEDTHCYPLLKYENGNWKLYEDSREQLEEYWGSDIADKIESHVNEFGVPYLRSK